MSITMLEYKSMSSSYPRKRIPSKGERKLRECLGGCGKLFMTTPETRVCIRCKRQNEERDDSSPYSVTYFTNKKDD